MLQNYNSAEIINVGAGKDISIKELSLLIADAVGFQGEINFSLEKPDGTFRKLLDVKKLAELGWSPKITLYDGILKTIIEYSKLLNKKN